MNGMRHSLQQQDIQSLAAQLHGYVGADLAAVCTRAAFLALQRHISGQEKLAAADAELHAGHEDAPQLVVRLLASLSRVH